MRCRVSSSVWRWLNTTTSVDQGSASIFTSISVSITELWQGNWTDVLIHVTTSINRQADWHFYTITASETGMTSVAFGNRCDTCFVCRRNSKSTSAHVILTNLTTWETVETEMVTPKLDLHSQTATKKRKCKLVVQWLTLRELQHCTFWSKK